MCTVREMRVGDVPEVVRVHLASFPGFFLSFLGPRFLRLLYGEILRQPDHVALVGLNAAGKVTGFVAGVEKQTGFYARLARRRWWAFGWAAVGAALRRPSVLPRLCRAFTYSRRAGEAACEALLLSVAVLPEAQGTGLGQALVHEFLGQMARRHVGQVSLTTDQDNNERVNRFYRRLGFQLARTYVTHEGRKMNEYIIPVSSPPALPQQTQSV